MIKRRKQVVFLVAHQDDECFMSTRLTRELARGHAVRFVFLTDGSAGGVPPETRDAESTRVLLDLGLGENDLFFIGSKLGIEDGALHTRLDRAWDGLIEALGTTTADRIFTCAYEGGHQDHDATHLLALALAKRAGRLHAMWQLPMYNGYGTRWKFFRVGRAVPTRGRRLTRSLAGEAVGRHAGLCRRYPSQWRSWIGLFPEWLVRLYVLRREMLLPALPVAPPHRPHEGKLLYERRTAVTFDEFRAATRGFHEDRLG